MMVGTGDGKRARNITHARAHREQKRKTLMTRLFISEMRFVCKLHSREIQRGGPRNAAFLSSYRSEALPRDRIWRTRANRLNYTVQTSFLPAENRTQRHKIKIPRSREYWILFGRFLASHVFHRAETPSGIRMVDVDVFKLCFSSKNYFRGRRNVF